MKEIEISMSLSHSYPFLDLSRRLGVPYERVLAASQRLDDGWVDPDNTQQMVLLARECGLTRGQTDLVERVCSAPWRWQFPPQGRGL